MENPAQWNSFTNLSVWYADRCLRRVQTLTAPVVLIQRWWRQRHLPRSKQVLYPIVIERRARFVNECVHQLIPREDPILKANVVAYEKLDGTNFGICCNGMVFGRRIRAEGERYQGVPLEGAIPEIETVRAVKKSILETVGETMYAKDPMLFLYGELMCNPGRYKYQERDMGKTWLCFGAVFASRKGEAQDQFAQDAESLVGKLVENGFLATRSPEDGKVTIRMNGTLLELLEAKGITCVPFVDAGEFREVCFRNKSMMMDCNHEGMVLAGENFPLQKWKTGYEDESSGYLLSSVLVRDYSTTTLALAGVDVELVQLLADVAGNKKNGTRKTTKTKTVVKVSAFEQSVLDKALDSALTKYDSLVEYFSRGEMKAIIAALYNELVTDIGASSVEEKKCINNFLRKRVGMAYGAWKRRTQ